jgi:hypothetical protein
MKKITLFLVALFVASISLYSLQAHAASGFDPSRIIDDAVFTNTGTMNASQIQSFLNSKVPTCDTNGTQSAADFGYPNLTHAQYAAKVGWPSPPYTCLRDYNENNLSSAQIIYNVAQQYRINPQVLVVLLQKEQGLVTDTWPLPSQYKTATGYGCPDTAACDTTYYGFTNQVTWAAKMFRYILDQNPNWYSPYILGNNYIQWSPTSSCGGSNVNVQNLSTVALYDYTPYQPNQAALNAGYGQGDSCSAYGNRNFYLYFTDWFGNTQGGPAYQWSVDSFSVYSDPNYTNKIGDSNTKITLQPGQTAYVRVAARNTGANTWNEYTKFETTNTPVVGNNTWLAYNYPAQLTNYPVGYNQVGIYNFSFTAPTTAGSYYQSFNIIQNDSIWLNDPGVGINLDSITPLVAPAPSSINQVSSGQVLQLGQSIQSPVNHSTFRFEHGQLSLYVNLNKVWGTSIPNSQAYYFSNQSDGNLVLYDKNWKPIWATGTDGKGASNLYLQSDGNLVLYSAGGATWSTNTSTQSELQTVNLSLKTNSIIFKGQTLTTPDRKYNLVLQTDGNLVLYNANWKPIWATGTDGSSADRLTLQTDGNLVLYNANWKPIWATGTDGNGSSSLYLQLDHNVVLYSSTRATWATGTAGR